MPIVFKRIIHFFIVLLCTKLISAAIITEIMYNPPGNDENHEWIEIFNDANTTFIEDYRLVEGSTNHQINTVNQSQLLNNSYAVIADDWETFLQDYPDFTGIIFDSSFSLSNTGEAIALKNSFTDNTTYTTTFANGNGNSISRVNDSWLESLPTPGQPNKLFETCDWKITIISEKDIFKDDFGFKAVVEKNFGKEVNLTILRSIEDEDEIVRAYDPLTRNYSATKTKETLAYSPNLKPGPYLVNASIANLSCHDTNLEDNHDSRLFYIIGNVQDDTVEKKTDSYVKIEDIYDLGNDGKAEFGQTIRTKIVIYKGDTKKSSVKLWIGDGKIKISKETSLKMQDKFQSLNIVLPIPLDTNCDGKLKEGEYKIFIEGLDEKDSEKLRVEGIKKGICKEIIVEKNSTKQISKKTKDITTNVPKPITGNLIKENIVQGTVYESKNYKIMKILPIFIITITTLLCILLIWKR